jgi:hypothetical protein
VSAAEPQMGIMMKKTFLKLLRQAVQDQSDNQLAIGRMPAATDNDHDRLELIIQRKTGGKAQRYDLADQYIKYTKGKGLVQIAEEIITSYWKKTGERPVRAGSDGIKESLARFTLVKERVLFKLVHYYQNRALLSGVPHIRFLDLAIVFYCDITDEGQGAVVINNAQWRKWKVSLKSLCLYALKNTPLLCSPNVQTMEDIIRRNLEKTIRAKYRESDERTIRELVGRLFQNRDAGGMHEYVRQSEDRYKMYVLSNDRKQFGAAVMLYPKLLKHFADRLGTNLFLLPSSIHEIILVPDDHQQDVEELQKMVDTVNNTRVGPEDILSYSIY